MEKIDMKKLLEDINELIGEEQLADEIQPEVAPEVVEPEETPELDKPEFNDTMSLADEFDAKARIARALEALQAAVDEFKDATAEKVDLVADNLLIQEIEGLDGAVKAVEDALRGGSNLLDSELNDAFNAELPGEGQEIEEPAEPVEGEETEETAETEEPEEEKTEEDEEAEQADLDLQFDNLASFDLLGNGEKEEEV